MKITKNRVVTRIFQKLGSHYVKVRVLIRLSCQPPCRVLFTKGGGSREPKDLLLASYALEEILEVLF